MDKKQMRAITDWLIDNIVRNEKIMFDDFIWNQELDCYGQKIDLVDVIVSLHDLLYEQIYGERYDYMWHWANKIGSDCIDTCFDTLLLNNKETE